MSKNCNHNDILLKRNGTDQNQRYINALDPNSVKLHDLNVEDWMSFAHTFAGSINYFKTATNAKDGNWEQFFIQKDKIKDILLDAETNEDLNPHLTLFVCFLSLIEFSQKRLNQLSKKHLDFYYKKVLNLTNKEATPDKVHVLFELAKNASEVRVEEQTSLDAEKDALGNKRTYKTQEELIVNKAQVTSLKNVFHHKDNGIKYSEVANSYDGLGEDFPNDEIKWWPFGHPDFKDEEDFPNLPNAKLGFAIASPILLLKEGKRTITFTIDFDKPKENFSKDLLDEGLEILLSGEKEWIPATINSSESSFQDRKFIIVAELTEAVDAIVPYKKEVLLENFSSTNPIARFLFKTEEDKSGYKLYTILKNNKINTITIDVDVQEMQEVILENDLGRLDVSKPFLPFGPQPVKGSKLYIGCQEALNKPWNEVTIDLEWKDTPFYGGITNHFKEHYIAYRNDYIDNLGKNTYTLTTTSKEGLQVFKSDNKSSIIAPLPINLELGFEAGRIVESFINKDGGLIISDDDDFKVTLETLNDKNWQLQTEPTGEELFIKNGDNYTSKLSISQVNNEPKSQGSSFRKAVKGGFAERTFGLHKINNTFIKNDITRIIGTNLSFDFSANIMEGVLGLFDNPIQQENFSSTAKKGFIRLSLQQSFLHDLFPRIFAVALSKEGETALIPNEPYTPLVETIRISYSASVSKKFDLDSSETNLKQNLTDYLDESVELFHEHPFGQSEQHTYLKTKHDFLKDKQCKLVANHDDGELYIALENAEQLQQISLLVQVLEGSENPEYEGVKTFEGNEKLDWYILSNDEWKPLNENFIVANNTDNFLRSGIVRISIPKEATKDNNRIPGNFFWLKVCNVKEFDTVCQMVNIHTQAQIAQFYNNNNDLSHLQTGLPEKTISKLVERIATLKGVSQPYSSFDGVPKESDAQFYRRISERLRHKQRAITIWDYEQLILQQFPKIYKVNCLKHTLGLSALSPGNVTIIVVPNIIDQNVFDILKPRISKAKRNEIQNFINLLNTLHVNTLVENPSYQEVKIALKVKFYEGKDENFYAKQLKKDITKFLAPWAYEETAEINFGLTLHKSVIIYYIEKLDYVDYIKDFELQIETKNKDVNGDFVFETVDKVVPTNSKVILTSVKYEQHNVEVISIEECVIV